MTLFNGNPINWEAFTKGQVACFEYESTKLETKNPFIKDTDEWYSWNKGWNATDLKITNEK